VTVARITIPPQDFDTDARRQACENLVFTPWHSVTEHQPIGGINRLKLKVYEASAALRHFPKEPAGATVPAGPAAGPPLGGLSGADRKTLYHLPEGSELFPLDWLRAMTSVKTGKPFLADLGRFGLIADPDGDDIGGGVKLPVGVTRAVPRGSGTEMLGVNCAACHVAELRFKGATVRVDGAPSLFDIQGFYEEMFQSAGATLTDPKRLVPFLRTLKADGPRDPATKLLVGLLPFLTGPANAGGFEAILLRRLRAAVRGGRTSRRPRPCSPLRTGETGSPPPPGRRRPGSRRSKRRRRSWRDSRGSPPGWGPTGRPSRCWWPGSRS
jgi:hypothetical protein